MTPNFLHDLLVSKKIFIACGPGGVGKTTSSAALALYSARQGYKTLVLTIDPAKRLANSLGIENIDHQERAIPKNELEKAGIKNGSLYAMMLDTKHTFDALIKKYSPSPEAAEEVLNNKLYQHLSNMIAGSQEYMAMEKLFEIAESQKYDKIILDTPPSRHALDFLDAPKKMSSLIGDSLMKFFVKPSLFVGKTGLKILDRSTRRVFKSFDKVAGFEFLQDLSEMLSTTSGLLDGFRERAEKVQQLLHESTTAFLLVATPQPIPLNEAEFFYARIQESELPFGGFIMNRVQFMPESDETGISKLGSNTRKEYDDVKELFESLAGRDQSELKRFEKQIKVPNLKKLLSTVPQLDHDVHDLKGLKELGELLFASH